MKRTLNLSGQRGPRLRATVILLTALLVATLPVVAIAQSTLYQVYVTDVGAAQFVVTWITDTAGDGHVDWGPTTSLGNTASDPDTSTTMHRVVVSGLSPSTPYYFQVRSGTITDDNGGDYYQVTTGASLTPPLPGRIVWGYVKQSDGTTPVADALVYLQLQDNDGGGDPGASQWVTTQTDGSGVWAYDLNNVRRDDGSAYFDFADGSDNLRFVSQGAAQGVEGEDGAERVQATPTTYDAQLADAVLSGTLNGSPIVGHDHWGETWTGSGTGLTAMSSDGTALRGETSYTSGIGIVGVASTATGPNIGVWGVTNSVVGQGVFGWASNPGGSAGGAVPRGVYGQTDSNVGIGIYGYAGSPTGFTTGLFGHAASEDGRGLIGLADNAHPTKTTIGVWGVSGSGTGRGLFGYANHPTGTNAGVYGQTDSTGGWAGQFVTSAGNGVYISAPAQNVGLTVASGSKNAVVATSDGSRLLYSEEATEVWFADYGFGQLQEGAAAVKIDPVFAQTVNLQEPYHVFVSVYGDADVYVSARTPEMFEVRLRDGDPNVEFSYRLVAKRLGFEDQRLEHAPWADNDPNLYPEQGMTWTDMMGTELAVPAVAAPQQLEIAPESP